MKKPAGPVKEREIQKESCWAQTYSSYRAPDTHTHTALIHFNESREEHKGITSINAKSIQHNRGYMQKICVLVCVSLCVLVHM